MKNLVHDVLAIFSHQTVDPVFVRAGLSHREKATLQAIGITTVNWVASMQELNDAFARKTLDAGAVGYHITQVESHKPGNDEQFLLNATATLYKVDAKAAHG